jgi:hypothetical protein
LDTFSLALVPEHARTPIMAQLNSMRIEPSHGHNGSATRTARCATVIIIYDEDVPSPRDRTANGQDGDLCAEPSRRAAAAPEYDDMLLGVGGGDITEYLVVAHGIARHRGGNHRERECH